MKEKFLELFGLVKALDKGVIIKAGLVVGGALAGIALANALGREPQEDDVLSPDRYNVEFGEENL